MCLLLGGGDVPPGNAALADAGDGLHRQILHLPFVDILSPVAGEADSHVGEPLHILDGQQHTEALALHRARAHPAGEAVEITEIILRRGPVAVEIAGVFPQGEFRGLLRVAVHILIAEAEHDVGAGSGHFRVVGVDRDQIAFLLIPGEQAAPLGIGLQGELTRGAAGVQAQARDVRRPVEFLRDQGEIEAQEGILVSGPQAAPAAVIDCDRQDARHFAVALGDAAVPQVRGGHPLLWGEPRRIRRSIAPQDGGDIQDLRQVRQGPREGKALPLLPQAGIVLDAAHAALQHGPGRRAADHRQRRVPNAPVDIPVANLQGQGFTEVAGPGDGLGIVALVAGGKALQARHILIRKLDAEDHVAGNALYAALA